MIRKRLYYRGHVQGVGFRYTTRQVAANYDVTGYVRNLADGRVEVVVEGDASTVAAFLDALADAMSGYIRGVEPHDEPPTRSFESFTIRH